MLSHPSLACVLTQTAPHYLCCLLSCAGDSDVPPACIGVARRMMVPTRQQQASVMLEAAANHTPEVRGSRPWSGVGWGGAGAEFL